MTHILQLSAEEHTSRSGSLAYHYSVFVVLHDKGELVLCDVLPIHFQQRLVCELAYLPDIGFNTMQPMTGALDNTLDCIDKLLLFACKYIPPYKFWRFPFFIWSETMKSSSQIIKRQHAVFFFYIFYYLSPVLMIVQF